MLKNNVSLFSTPTICTTNQIHLFAIIIKLNASTMYKKINLLIFFIKNNSLIILLISSRN